MAATRDAWRIDRAGSLNRLTLRTEPLADLRPGEARVAVKAIGLNFADLFACLGLYSATPAGSFVPGLEFAGLVEETASTSVQPGDRVVGLTRFGAYASALNVPVELLRPIRPAWTFAEAAALPVQGLTAWYGLVRLGAVVRRHVVLVQSAAGGVGLNALAILEALEARAIAVVGTEAKRQWLIDQRGLAADCVIVRNPRTFGAQLDRALRMLDARGFDIVFDAVAGPYLRPAYERLRPQGRLVVYGAADYMSRRPRPDYFRMLPRYIRRFRPDPLQMMSENRSVMGFNLIWLWDQADQLAPAWDALDTLVVRPPLVGHEFRFGDAPAAMRYLQAGQSIGKVVLTT